MTIIEALDALEKIKGTIEALAADNERLRLRLRAASGDNMVLISREEHEHLVAIAELFQ